jgi:hypothetical protein
MSTSATVGHTSSWRWQKLKKEIMCIMVFFINVWLLLSLKLNTTEHFGYNLNKIIISTATIC